MFFSLRLTLALLCTLFPYTTLFRSFTGYVRLVWYLAAYIPVGLPVLKDAVKSIRKGNFFSEFFLIDRKSTRPNSSHVKISYAVFCLKKKNQQTVLTFSTRTTRYSSP